MSKKIKGDDLKKFGYSEGKILGLALTIDEKLNGASKNEMLMHLKKVKDYPESFLDDPEMKPLAQAMIDEARAPLVATIPLRHDVPAYSIYGESFIEGGAKSQMDIAMKLPVAVGGALMPDAHQG